MRSQVADKVRRGCLSTVPLHNDDQGRKGKGEGTVTGDDTPQKGKGWTKKGKGGKGEK